MVRLLLKSLKYGWITVLRGSDEQFHYKELEIGQVKDYLAEKGISVRR